MEVHTLTRTSNTHTHTHHTHTHTHTRTHTFSDVVLLLNVGLFRGNVGLFCGNIIIVYGKLHLLYIVTIDVVSLALYSTTHNKSISAKEPHISAKESYNSVKGAYVYENYVHTTDACCKDDGYGKGIMSAKKPHISAKEPCIGTGRTDAFRDCL